MCGIHGLVQLNNFVNGPACSFIRDGFVAGSLRGMDSSGIFQLDKKFKAYTHKKAIAGPDFIYTKMADRFIKDSDMSRLTVCHVRHATSGKVQEDNAHPFIADCPDGKHWVVGVHNGTLDAGWKQKEGAKDYTVDSEWAISHIATKGYDAFKDFKGAFCFVWWDGRNKDKFYICRNDQRPMHFRLTKNKKQMYFGSEAGMLAWLTERNAVGADSDIYIVEKDKIYEFDLSKETVEWMKTDMPKFQAAYTTYVAPARNWREDNKAIIDQADMNKFLAGIKKAAGGARDVIALELATDNGRKTKDKKKIPLAERAVLEVIISDKDDTLEEIPRPLAPAGTSTPLNLSDLETPSDLKDDKKSETETERVIREVAEAVSMGLTEPDPTTKTTGVTSKQGDEASDWLAKLNWYDPSTATLAEQTTAAFWELQGEVHWFHGTSYDPDTETVFGEVRDYLPGKGHVEYVAVIRGVPARQAHARYINNRDPVSKIAGDYAVIIGVNEDPTLGRMFIMAELSDEGRAQYRKKAN